MTTKKYNGIDHYISNNITRSRDCQDLPVRGAVIGLGTHSKQIFPFYPYVATQIWNFEKTFAGIPLKREKSRVQVSL